MQMAQLSWAIDLSALTQLQDWVPAGCGRATQPCIGEQGDSILAQLAGGSSGGMCFLSAGNAFEQVLLLGWAFRWESSRCSQSEPQDK